MPGKRAKTECTGKVETDVLPSRSVANLAPGKVNDESGPDSSLPRQGINETDLPRDYCHRIGSQWIGFPVWQRGTGQEKEKTVLAKAEKKMAGLLRDLMKRKGGSFFESAVDPRPDESGGLDDYFEKVTDPIDLRTILSSLELGFYCDTKNSDSWVERVAQDVEQVWKNAELFNPAGHIVHQSAKELRVYFMEQLDKQVKKELTCVDAKKHHEAEWPLQLVLNNFAFLDSAGKILAAASVMERGFVGVVLTGQVMRNRPNPSSNTDCPANKHQDYPTKNVEVIPKAWHFECEETKESSSCRKTGEVVVWVRTEHAWIRLMNAAAVWQIQAAQWRQKMRLVSILCVCVTETPREAPDRIIRQVIKAALFKGGGKAEEERLLSALLDVAEFAALELERHWLAEGSKLTPQNGKKLVSKLLKDAEKARASFMTGASKTNSCAPLSCAPREDREDWAIGCMLSSLISRLQTDVLRAAWGLNVKTASKDDPARNKPASLMQHAQGLPAQCSSNKRPQSGSDAGEEVQPEGEVKQEEHDKQGHWERDSEGKRVWVNPTLDSTEMMKTPVNGGSSRGRGGSSRGRGGGRGGRGATSGSSTSNASSSTYCAGTRVRVIFDDGLWYVGKLQSLKGKKWRVLFGNDDQDDMALPDPDAISVPSVDAMLTAVDHTAEAIEEALRDLCESSNAPKALSNKHSDLQLKAQAAHQAIKTDVKGKEIGALPEYMWSAEGVQNEILKMVKASLGGGDRNACLKDEQWATIEKSCKKIIKRRTAKAAATGSGAPEAPAEEQAAAGRKRAATTLESEGKVQSSRSKKRAKAEDSPLIVEGETENSEAMSEAKESKHDKKPKIWNDTPEWLEPDAIIEVECDSEWWQAKAVELKKGKIKFEYVGGSEEDVEWIPANSKRLRPAQGTPIEGLVGEMVQAKRLKDKGDSKDSWNLAVVVQVKDEDDIPVVRVRYLQRRGVKDEWLTIDTALVRKLEGAEADEDNIKVEADDGAPWPKGTRAFADADKESFAHCLVVLEFLATFGQTSLLMSAPVKHASSPPELQMSWESLNTVRMMQMMNGSNQEECIMDLALRLVALLVKEQDSTEQGFVAPNGLNLVAWVKRLIQKDMFERASRILHERVEEAYTAEYVLEKAGLCRAVLNKGKSTQGHYSNLSVKGDDMGCVDGLDGLEVEVICSDTHNGVILAGYLMPATESGVGVLVNCNGIEMSLSDFAHFAHTCSYIPPLQDPKKTIRVKQSGETLQEWEAAGRKAKWESSEKGSERAEPTDERAAIVCAAVRGSQHDKRTIDALENLLGKQVMKEERELLDKLSNCDWTNLAAHMKWRALAWLCDAVAESDFMRLRLQEHVDAMTCKPEKKVATAFDLFLADRGAGPLAPPHRLREVQLEWDRSTEAVRSEWSEKAKSLDKEQRKAEKIEAESDKLSAKVRHEPVGVDRQSRKYWLLRRNPKEWLLAVQLPHIHAYPFEVYPRTGTNRKELFEPAPAWRYYSTVDELVGLVAYLDSSDDGDIKLSRRLQLDLHAVLPPAPGKASDEFKSRGDEGAATRAGAQAREVLSSAQPSIQAAPHNTAHLGAWNAAGAAQQATVGTAQHAAHEASLPTSRSVIMQMPDPFRKFPKKNGEYLAEDDETPRVIANNFGIDVDALVNINRHLYEGLHAGARFKGGTMVFLPTPTIAGLRRSATSSPLELLNDIVKIISCELEIIPLCPRIENAFTSWKAVVQELLAAKEQQYAQLFKVVAHATVSLEHSLALPVYVPSGSDGEEQHEHRPMETRLLPAHWLSNLRQNWVLEMETVTTLSQLGLLLEELQLFGLAGMRDIRSHSTSCWFFGAECRRLQKLARSRGRGSSGSSAVLTVAANVAADMNKPLIHIPELQEQVVYFLKGHQIHLADHEYPECPWDSCPDVPMALCIVEERHHFRQSNSEMACFCAMRLRPVCQGSDLVNKSIFLHNWGAAVFPGQPSMPEHRLPCSVRDFKQTIVEVPHMLIPPPAFPGGGMMNAGGSGTMHPPPGPPMANMQQVMNQHVMKHLSSTPGALSAAHALAAHISTTVPSAPPHAASTKASEAGGAAAQNVASTPPSHAGAEGAVSAITQTSAIRQTPSAPPASTGGGHDGKIGEHKSVRDNVVYTQRTINEYLIRWDANLPEQWINLDNVKYSMQSPDQGGASFWVTLHYEQKHPEFLLNPREFAQLNMRWKPNTRIQMFWKNEDHPQGGEYYTGEVIEHSDGPDPWDSVHVKWDTPEGEQEDHDWVCPWELQVCQRDGWASRSNLPGANNMVVRNAGEAARMPSGGYWTAASTDDDSPLSIAQKKGLDVELIVLLNKEQLKGLTRYSKLLNGTKVRLPPKGYRYQRSGGTVINTTADGTAEMQFPKEDEIFWDGAWTEDKRKISDDVLKKILRQRGIGPFLTPVDHEALGLKDYTTVIKAPMDLGTVESRFKGTDGEEEYSLPKDFYREMKLVFENAKQYNPPGSDLHRKAVQFLNQFEDWWREKWRDDQARIAEEQKKRKIAGESAYMQKKRLALAAMSSMAPPATPPAPQLTGGYLQTLQMLQQTPHLSFVMPQPPAIAVPVAGAVAEGSTGTDRKSTVTCGVCGGDGHNRRTCPHADGSNQKKEAHLHNNHD